MVVAFTFMTVGAFCYMLAYRQEHRRVDHLKRLNRMLNLELNTSRHLQQHKDQLDWFKSYMEVYDSYKEHEKAHIEFLRKRFGSKF